MRPRPTYRDLNPTRSETPLILRLAAWFGFAAVLLGVVFTIAYTSF